MSVIQVRQQQEQAPWWAQLAAQTLVPMITSALDRQKERDNNRKENVMRGQVRSKIDELIGANGGTADILPPLSSTLGGNGWENAFHNTDNSLGSFGEAVGLSNIASQAAQSLGLHGTGTASTPYTPTPADWRRIIDTIRADKRFSHLSPQAIDELFASDIQAAEAARMEARKSKLAQDYLDAMGDATKQRDITMSGRIQDLVPDSVMNMGQTMYQYENPHYQTSTLNLGGQQQMISVNPRTGEVTTGPAFTNTLSPEEVAANQHSQAVLDETIRSNKANEEYRSAQLAEQSKPKLTNVVQLQDGRRVGIFSDGTERELTPDTAGFSSIETQRLTDLQTRRQGLITQQTALQTALAKAQTSEERASFQSSLNEVNAQIKSIDDAIDSMYEQKLSLQTQSTTSTQKVAPENELWTPTNNDDPSAFDIGAHMTGNAHGGPNGISTPYKTTRVRQDGSTYTHYGVDYKTPNGTEILVPDVGTALNVVKVGNQPDGYGHYVRLRGNLNGHRVELTIAHMQDGVNVKEGDTVYAGNLIGLSGNSGNSRGKNGGYHMHLETKLDGEYVDPTQFRKTIQPYITRGTGDTGNANGIAFALSAPIKNGSGYKNQITVQEFNELVRLAETGQFPDAPNVRTRADVIKYLLDMGGRPFNEDILAEARKLTGTQSNSQTTQEQDDETEEQSNGHAVQPNAQVATAQQGSGLTPVHALEVGDMAEVPEPVSRDIQPTRTAQQTPTPTTTTSWNPLVATPAYADDLPLDAVSGASPDDGGLTQYRAEDDTSPVTWRNASGSPRLTSDGQLFTQKIYDEWATKADAGGFRDVGINNRVDLDKWLNSIGMSPYRPAEQRGLNNLNGRSNANLPPEGVDDGVMPFDSRPSTSPEKYPAPTFTDELNGTTPADTQDLLDGLNGITDSRYRNWARALRQYYPSATYTPEINIPERPNMPEAQHMPTGTPSSNGAIPTQARASSALPQRTALAPRRVAPKPRRGYTNYEEQRNAVDTAAKNNGIDSNLIRAIIEVESSWRPTARSKAGAMGLMQLMPGTARELGVRNAYDPAQNIAGGSKYIARLIRRYGGDVSKALMAYNCGPGNVAKGRIPQASRQYAQKVMSIYNRLRG